MYKAICYVAGLVFALLSISSWLYSTYYLLLLRAENTPFVFSPNGMSPVGRGYRRQFFRGIIAGLAFGVVASVLSHLIQE